MSAAPKYLPDYDDWCKEQHQAADLAELSGLVLAALPCLRLACVCADHTCPRCRIEYLAAVNAPPRLPDVGATCADDGEAPF